MAKTIVFASIIAMAALMVGSSTMPAMAEWTYGEEENRGVSTFDASDSTWTFGSEENKGVSTFDANESVWTIGSWGVTETTTVSETTETTIQTTTDSTTIDTGKMTNSGLQCVQTFFGLQCS